MQDPRQEDTIVAIATPPGPGAIGIVRLSGAKAQPILGRLWMNPRPSVDKLEDKRFYLVNLTDPSTGYPLDRLLVVCFQAPHTYTGEDVVEFHAHGNPLLLDQIVRCCLAAGARLAEPGEFTRRAFMNGKMDLTQAEAVADVIAAASLQGARCAQQQLEGRLSRVVREHLSSLTALRAFTEASIDFPEEDLHLLALAQVATKVCALRDALVALQATFHAGRWYRDGAQVLLLGPPNAGKSMLLNALLGESRAIVHANAGTTRDTLEEQVLWSGMPIRLVDTAGLREVDAASSPHAEIEAVGIQRTKAMIAGADRFVVVLDGHAATASTEVLPLEALPADRTVVWCNKSDLGLRCDPHTLERWFPGVPLVTGSALTGEGLDQLRDTILRSLQDSAGGDAEGVTITNRRHKEALDQAVQDLSAGVAALADAQSPEFVAEHLRMASEALGRIVGVVTTEELLSEIFGKFCIGK